MESIDTRRTKAEPYRNTNERINRLIEDGLEANIWIVTGVIGRKVILAGSEQEAVEKYNLRPNHWSKEFREEL